MVLQATPIVVADGRRHRSYPDAAENTPTVDQTVIRHVADTAAHATRQTPVVAIPDGRDDIAFTAEGMESAPIVVTEAPQFAGAVAGVVAALEAVDTPWAVVCAGDMPRLSARAIRLLENRAERLSPAGVVPVADGRPEPLHGVYRVSDLQRALDDACEQTSIRGVVERLSPLITVPTTHADASIRTSLSHPTADIDGEPGETHNNPSNNVTGTQRARRQPEFTLQ